MYSNLLGEFMGTMTLCAYGNAVVANILLKDSKAGGAGWVHVNWGWSFGLMMGIFTAWACGAPQADLNPAVTLFKTLGGVYTPAQCIATCIAEIAGGVAGGVVCYFVYLNHWAPTEDPGLKLAVFATVPARMDKGANFLTEAIATFFLIFGIMTIVAKGTALPGYLVPFMIGGLLYALGAGFGGPTGYGMNPARDLGPRIAHAILPIPGKGSSGWDYAPIPFVGPIVGGLIAFPICRFFGLF